MDKRSKASIILGIIAMAMSLVLVTAAPALAGKGDKGGKDSSGYTEDNDTNDNNTANNVSDEGDNKHPSGKDRSVENGGSGNQGNSSSDPDDDGRGPDRSNGGPDKPNGSGGDDLADQDGNNGCGNDDDFEDDNEGWCGKPPKDEVKGDKTECPTDMVKGKSHGKGKGKGKGKSTGSKSCDKPPTCPAEGTMGGNTSTGTCGNVGGGAVVAPTETDCPKDDSMASGSEKDCDEVEGEVISKPDDEVLGGTIDAAPEDTVLGERISDEGSDADVAAERSSGQTLPFTGASLLAFLGIALGLITSGFLFWRKDRS
jgi:hypothetical protein